jgi:HK97 family phage major capsid protein
MPATPEFKTRESAQLYIESHEREQEAELKKLFRARGSKTALESCKALMESGDGGILVPINWASDVLSNPIDSDIIRRVRRVPTRSPINRVARISGPSSDNPVAASPVWFNEVNVGPLDVLFVTTESTTISTPSVEIRGDISLSMIEDTPSLSSLLRDILGRKISLAIESMILQGMPAGFFPDGSGGGPFGLNETGIVPRVAAAGATIAYDDLLSLFWGLPRQYHASAVWVFNNATGLAISKLKDTQGMPLWTPGGLLFDRPVVLSDAADAIAASKTPIWFGDLQSYTLMLRTEPAVLTILDQIGYAQGRVLFSLRQRVGGRVTWSDGIRGLSMPKP